MDESFSQKNKLKSKTLIASLFTEGKSVTQFPLKLVYIPVTKANFKANKTAFSVPKRNFKKAVDRNFLKRLLREVFRKNKHLLENEQKFAFMLIYLGKKKTDYQQLFSSTQKLLKKFAEKEFKNN